MASSDGMSLPLLSSLFQSIRDLECGFAQGPCPVGTAGGGAPVWPLDSSWGPGVESPSLSRGQRRGLSGAGAQLFTSTQEFHQ